MYAEDEVGRRIPLGWGGTTNNETTGNLIQTVEAIAFGQPVLLRIGMPRQEDEYAVIVPLVLDANRTQPDFYLNLGMEGDGNLVFFPDLAQNGRHPEVIIIRTMMMPLVVYVPE